ncbi:MAG: hypothetical protein JNK76_25845 [Planctomycetales bacterium]|nr:hypothetical protein [Planctomycetales bacterium]
MIKLDMDGVLFDIVGAVGRLFDRPNLEAEWPLGEYGFSTALQVPEAEIWARVDAEGVGFWADMPVLPWADRLVSFCFSLGMEVRIVSDTSYGRWADAGKRIALERHFGGRLAKSWHFTRFKADLAQSGRCLIDDSDENVRKFQAAGGQAVLVPQPWNALHFEEWRDPAAKFAYVKEAVLRTCVGE